MPNNNIKMNTNNSYIVIVLIILLFDISFGIENNKKNVIIKSKSSLTKIKSKSTSLSEIKSIKSNNVINILKKTSILLSLSPLSSIICNAQVKGAFELDMEYYLRNVINGNNNNIKSFNEKNVRKSIVPSPRIMNILITTKIINKIKNIICNISKISIDSLDKFIENELPIKLKKFKEYVPIVNENYSDQYYFDIYLYLMYKSIENIIAKSEDRVILRNKVGDEILDLLIKDKVININNNNNNDKNNRNVEILAKNIKIILQSFQSIGLIKNFNFDDEDLSDLNYADQSFNSGLPISFQFTLIEPATILGFIEQNKSDTFFHSEIIATTISSYCKSLGFDTKFEDYLVDEYYRTENFDLQAQDILIEMLIK